MSSDWKQNLYEVGLAGAAAPAALLFVAAVIKWEILGTVFLYVMVALLFVLDGLAYPAGVWFSRGREGRAAIVAYARRRWPLATLGGSASIGSYAIALWAMTRAPVASVAALRETSVLFAALLGTVLLKERFGLQRALGTAVIVAGVMALRLG